MDPRKEELDEAPGELSEHAQDVEFEDVLRPFGDDELVDVLVDELEHDPADAVG